MKTSFVTDLNSEQSITTFFLVHEKEIRNTREGQGLSQRCLAKARQAKTGPGRSTEVAGQRSLEGHWSVRQ